MLPQSLVKEALGIALSTGADYAEVFAEHTNQKAIQMISAKVDKIEDAVIAGVGIRIFKGTRCISGSASSLERSAVLACARKVADALIGSSTVADVVLRERRFGDIHPVKIVPVSVENKAKVGFLREACLAAKDYHQDISQVTGTFLDVDHNIMIATSEGLYAEDRQIRTRVAVSAIASKNGENQTGSCSPGARVGMELFELFPPKEVGIEAARQAITMINAGYIDAGVMPVAIENAFGGVIFHEACGHGLEASCVALGQSVFAGKLGQQIANPKVTAIDDGSIPNAWGSINIDDEGTPGRKNVLIENGILKSYMVDKLNGRRMGMAPTGNSRRQSYAYEPTSRMTNTYIAAGDDEICEPVRGASLIGKGSDILMDIDMVGKNLDRGQGMCGASSGSIPTDVGQPLIRVSSITVGGR